MPAWLIRTGDPTPRHANRFNFVLSFVYSLLLFVVLNVVHVNQTSNRWRIFRVGLRHLGFQIGTLDRLL